VIYNTSVSGITTIIIYETMLLSLVMLIGDDE
jgi:hypothetical protein